MHKRFYGKWDWEFDRGIDELVSSDLLPSDYAVAYYDAWGRLYRVVRHESSVTKDIYDYFCDDTGDVIEKRSLFEHVDGGVCIIVRYKRTEAKDTVTETAWWPDRETCPESVERVISRLTPFNS